MKPWYIQICKEDHTGDSQPLFSPEHEWACNLSEHAISGSHLGWSVIPAIYTVEALKENPLFIYP